MTEGSAHATQVVLAGRYRLVEALDRGPMAEVWEAYDEVLARPVAVKILHPRLAADEAFLERFRREAIGAGRLVHPNIVAIFDTGSEDGTAYLVNELVRRRTLRAVFDEEGALPAAAAVRMADEVAGALGYAHELGIVHRDLRPENVHLTDEGQLKISDFGMARVRARDETDDAPGPEARADARTDLRALGALLYEALCGRPPGPDPLRPRQVRPGIPRPLERIVVTALEGGFANATEFCTELRSVDVEDDDAAPLVVRDPTPPGGITPSFRQSERTWLVPAGLIVLLAAVLVTIGVLFAQTEVGSDLIERATGRDEPAGTTEAATGTTAVRASATAFDPEGDGEEHDEQAANAVDGSATTRWTTSTYRADGFSGLKPGVGLILRLEGPAALATIDVESPTKGWSAAVYVADAPGAQLADWGRPVATNGPLDGNLSAPLEGRRGGAVLLWITATGRTGGQFRTEIGEVRLSAAARR